MQPESSGVHFPLRHGEISRAHILKRVEPDFLESHHLRVHPHITVHRMRAIDIARFELLQLLHLRVIDGVGEIIAVHAPHIGLAPFIIELLHLVLTRLVQINRLFV